MTRHGHNRKRGPDGRRYRSPTYNSWRAMIERCERPRHPFYPIYGGRGIRVCDRWRSSFTAFLEDMGERLAGLTLDRINPDLDYEPGNCRWASKWQQRWNRRDMAMAREELVSVCVEILNTPSEGIPF